MNRIDKLFQQKSTDILNVYFTAGYPDLSDTLRVAKALQEAGTDLIEIGIPYSDPIADGTTIQESSAKALTNGMDLEKLFGQLKDLRKHVNVPVILMGYLNPILQYGMDRFCDDCKKVGIDGAIFPDMPMFEYRSFYRDLFEKSDIHNVFLITPQTTEERIREIDQNTEGFIYMVSSSSVTGAKTGISEEQISYFQRIRDMKLNKPTLIGFGISDQATFRQACTYSNGAIIGSAFINQLKADASDEAIHHFIKKIKA